MLIFLLIFFVYWFQMRRCISDFSLISFKKMCVDTLKKNLVYAYIFKIIIMKSLMIFSSPEPKAQGELLVWDSSWRPSVRPSTLSNMNISETSWPIIIKFHQEHHLGGGLTALGFG